MNKLEISLKFISILMCISFHCTSIFSQSKKQKIEILKSRIDSLNNVLLSELNSNRQKEIRNSEKLSKLEKDLRDCNKELNDKINHLNILENKINEKELLINKLISQVNKLEKDVEQLSLNSMIEIIAPPSYSISNSDLIAITDSKMVDPCPLMNVFGEKGPEICKKNVKKITYFKKGNTIRFFALVGYSFSGSHFEPGQNGYVLAEYRNSNWTLIDFIQVHHEGCFGNSLDVENQYILGENSFGYYSISCGTAQGFTACNSYIVGFVGDKTAVLLEEISSEDNLGEGVKPVINWKYNYQPVVTNNQLYFLERKHIKMNKIIESKKMIYNQEKMKFE